MIFQKDFGSSIDHFISIILYFDVVFFFFKLEYLTIILTMKFATLEQSSRVFNNEKEQKGKHESIKLYESNPL